MNVLVLDIGTSSMRGILFSETGERLTQTQVRYQPIHKTESWIEQSGGDWEGALASIVSQTVCRAKSQRLSIDMISITAQRSSVIPLDRAGKPLMPAIMWQDSRNAGICKELSAYDQLIFNLSRSAVNPVFFGGKLTWIHRMLPDIYKKTFKFVNVPQYVTYLMTGEYSTDYTYGSRTNLMNLQTCKWDPALLEIFEVSEDKLCRLQPPGSVCGRVNTGFAQKTGIREGTPVISAGGDQQCAAVGQGVYREGALSVVTGTGAFLICASPQIPPDLDRRLICNYSAVRGSYILEASMLTCCSAFDWYCDNFYDGLQGNYEKINLDLAKSYGGSDQCIALPYFQGRGSSDWNAEAKALFANITLSTKRRDMLKALVEGIFMEISNNIEILKQYVDIDSVYISGGLTNSRIMNQMQADIYRMDLQHMEDSESTALGALMVTLVDQGVYATYEEAFKKIRGGQPVDSYVANPHKSREYQDKIKLMNGLYESIYLRTGDRG